MHKNLTSSLLLGLALACPMALCTACGDDDPTPPTPPTPPTQSHPTFYYVEGYQPVCFEWMNIYSNLKCVDSEGNYTINIDIPHGIRTTPDEFTSFANITNTQLRLNIGYALSQEEESTYMFRTFKHECTELPDTFRVRHNYTVKENYTGTADKDFGIWLGGMAIDTDERASNLKTLRQQIRGVDEGKEQTLMQRLSENYDLNYIVSRDGSGTLVVAVEPAK